MRFELFDALIERLKQEGFTIGVDHYIRMERLLSQIEAPYDNERLKFLLCPLLATSAEEQECFRKVFDEIVPYGEDRLSQTIASVDTWPVPSGNFWMAALTALVIFILALVVYKRTGARDTPVFQSQSTNIAVEYVQISPQVRTVRRVLRSVVPRPETIHARAGWLIATLSLAAWAAYELYRRRKRLLVLKAEQQEGHPSRSELGSPDAPTRVYETPEFRYVARRMGERYPGNSTRFDVLRTILESAQKAVPRLVFTPELQTPEYVLLIDRRTARDHQWRLYDQMAAAFSSRNLSVTTLTFDGDPRLSRDKNGRWFFITEIEDLYATCRLLIVGRVQVLLDPLRGQVAGWTRVLHGFKESWLLAIGGADRRPFAGLVRVLPGTVEGLRQLLDRDRSPRYDPWASEPRGPALRELEDWLGEGVFRWCCACSVYPELSWGLTLRIASLNEICRETNLLTEGNLLKISSLSWFREGAFPESLRLQLLERVPEEVDVAVRKAVVHLIKDWPAPENSRAKARQDMEIWFDEHWAGRSDKREWKELVRRLRDERYRVVAQPYIPLLRREWRRRAWLAVLLPEWLCQKLFEDGIPTFGLALLGRCALAVLIAGLVLISPLRKRQITVFSPTGERILWEERYVRIPSGIFVMGCSAQDTQCYGNELRPHSARISRDFWIGETEVIVSNYKRFAEADRRQMPTPPAFNPDWNQGDQPIVNVNWPDAKSYCEWATEGRGGLPTEAEWEYVARGKSAASRYGPGDQIAWWIGNSAARAHSVKLKAPNLYGVSDTLGNVWEWVADWYSPEYRDSAAIDPVGPAQGQYRVVRGGSWESDDRDLRSSVRNREDPAKRVDTIGMRCAVGIP